MTRQEKPRVNVAVQWATDADKIPFSEITNAQIRRWVRACFTEAADITLRFVDSTEGRALNRDYRGKDYATNVLTFPIDLPDLGSLVEDIEESGPFVPTFIADIVVCPEVIEKEALEQNKDITHHLAHMVIHGCLHAQGHVHETDEEAQEMESREIEILKRFRISDPYYNSND